MSKVVGQGETIKAGDLGLRVRISFIEAGYHLAVNILSSKTDQNPNGLQVHTIWVQNIPAFGHLQQCRFIFRSSQTQREHC